jgi:hypothetical protein
MTPSELSLAARLGLLSAGLLDQTAVRDLLSEVMGTSMVYYLPPEIARYGADLITRKELKIRES